MRMRKLAGLVLLSLIPSLSAAGDGPALGMGTRVRVVSGPAGTPPVVGTVVAIDEDSMTLMNGDHRTVKLPRGLVTKLEVSWERKGHWWQGMLIGAAAGAGIGLAEGSTCDAYGCATRAQNAIWGSVALAGIGALIGKGVKSDRWTDMSLQVGSAPAARSIVAPGGAQRSRPTMGASLSLRF